MEHLLFASHSSGRHINSWVAGLVDIKHIFSPLMNGIVRKKKMVQCHEYVRYLHNADAPTYIKQAQCWPIGTIITAVTLFASPI